jgi:phosphatidate cytidylyltransferase
MLERIITALVLVAVVLSCMFATQSHYPMFVLMILAAGVAGYEWFKLMPHKEAIVSKPKAWIYGICVASVSTLALFFDDVALLLWAASILTWLGSIYWVKNFPESDNWYNVSLYAIGFILISAAVTAFMQFGIAHLGG